MQLTYRTKIQKQFFSLQNHPPNEINKYKFITKEKKESTNSKSPVLHENMKDKQTILQTLPQ